MQKEELLDVGIEMNNMFLNGEKMEKKFATLKNQVEQIFSFIIFQQ